MLKSILSLLFSLELLCSGIAPSPVQTRTTYQPVALSCAAQNIPEAQPVFWGLIDPELSVWFSRIPSDETESGDRILWDWSWRGFLAALFGHPVLKEAHPNAAQA